MQVMLKKKEIWDVFNSTKPKPITTAQIKKKEKDNAITSKIIKQEVNSNLYTNILRKRYSYQSWEILQKIWS